MCLGFVVANSIGEESYDFLDDHYLWEIQKNPAGLSTLTFNGKEWVQDSTLTPEAGAFRFGARVPAGLLFWT
jgi:hypothetical protein